MSEKAEEIVADWYDASAIQVYFPGSGDDCDCYVNDEVKQIAKLGRDYAALKRAVESMFDEHGRISMADAKDLFHLIKSL